MTDALVSVHLGIVFDVAHVTETDCFPEANDLIELVPGSLPE